MGKGGYDWAAIAADPRYRELSRRKRRLLAWLLLAAAAGYFLLPVGAALVPELFAMRLGGSVNLGVVFAFSEFAVALAVAVIYTRLANGDFDRVAADINRDAFTRYRRS